MGYAQDNFMTLSYPERKLIVVENDDDVEAVRRAEIEDAENNQAAEIEKGAGGAAEFLGNVAEAATATASRLWKARKVAKLAKLPFLVVTNSQARILSFPNGHPLSHVVYVGDPGVAGTYYPVANFHRFLFEGKVAEALRLLRSLGATEISIEYLEGFDRGAGVDLSASLPDGPGGKIAGGIRRKSKSASGAKTTMKLSPTARAQIPKDLHWFASEPLWREVAEARMENGLREFTIDLNYTDDFGVNSDLKSSIHDVGLELGGKFTEYKETVWRLSGSFSEKLSPNPPPLHS